MCDVSVSEDSLSFDVMLTLSQLLCKLDRLGFSIVLVVVKQKLLSDSSRSCVLGFLVHHFGLYII